MAFRRIRLFTALSPVAALLLAGNAVAGPREDLIAAFGKAMAGGSYTAEVIAKVKGADYPTRMQVQWPDRYHMKTPDTEMVILPGATWMNAGGQWMKMPMDMSKMIQGYSKQAMDEGVAGIGEVSVTGSETINGCESTLYSYTATGKFMGVENSSQAEVAVCGSSGLPVRMITGKPGDADRVVVNYDFAAEVSIQAPQ